MLQVRLKNKTTELDGNTWANVQEKLLHWVGTKHGVRLVEITH